MSKNNLVVKDNTLINASYTLTLTEQRLLLLSIAKAQKTGQKITHDDYMVIHANEFVDTFNSDAKTVYRDLRNACDTLFKREFSYRKGTRAIRSHWLQSSAYDDNNGSVELLFAKELIPFISQLEKRFTSYHLVDVAKMTSVYAIRLYELIIAWRSKHKTPIFDIEELRLKLGVEPHEYKEMHNFKKRVIDTAIKQINELSNIAIKMEQHKKGRKIVGFSFEFFEIDMPERDPNTVDWVEEEAPKKQRKVISKAEAERMARIGESWDELLARLTNDYVIKFKV